MDIDELLRITSSVPLGPLNLNYTASGTDKWTLIVTLAEERYTIQAEREPNTQGLVLTATLDIVMVDSAPRGAWVTQDDSATDGSIDRRLWLHGNGLTPALLLNALAELARVAAPDPAPADKGPEPALPAAETPSASEPAVTPALRTKLLPWQTLDAAPVQKPAAAEPVVEPDPVIATTESPPSEPIAPATVPAPYSQPSEPEPPAVATEPIAPAMPSMAVPTTDQAPAATQTPPSVTVTADGSIGRSGTCRECGTPFKADHAFCTNCGIRLE